MRKGVLLLAGLVALAPPVRGQEKPGSAPAAAEDKKLTFKFREASVDAVLQYVSSMTGWIFVQEKRIPGTIDAVSDTDVPVSKCLEFLNAALRRHEAAILNPYSPALPKPGQVLKVQDTVAARTRVVEIYTGANPDEIPITDQVRTQIIPLKSVNVVDVMTELGEVLRKSVDDVAVSTFSNALVLTGRSEGINRAARILQVIDVGATSELKIRVFPLRFADATETAKTLNEVFRMESTGRADASARDGAPRPAAARDRGAEGKDAPPAEPKEAPARAAAAGPEPRALAHEVVRITAESRTNSVIVSATEANLARIRELLDRLDDKLAAATKLKLYSLRYADATSVAKLVIELFSKKPASGAAPQPRAVPEVRTNSVMVEAAEQTLVLIDRIIQDVDRPVSDMLLVKVYELKNADPAQMTAILNSIFRPQVNATQNAGRSPEASGGAGPSQAAAATAPAPGTLPPFAGLLPSQEIEVTNDPRTHSVIVKASREYLKVVDEIIRQLDENPSEPMKTYVVPLRNADAATVALLLQNLLRSTQPAGTPAAAAGAPAPAGSSPYAVMQPLSAAGSGVGPGAAGGSATRRNLGPLGEQEPPAATPPQQQPPNAQEPHGIEPGLVDIQPDAATNSIVIRTSPRNFKSIQGVLQDLDRLRPQVLIKVLIADVTLDNSMTFGLQGFWDSAVLTASEQGTNQIGTAYPLGNTGLNYSLTTGTNRASATLNALATEGKLRILATPRILALDNQTANIIVGKQIPIVSNSTINSLGNTVNSVTYQSVGIILNVTPHINPDGLVTMIVAPQVSDVASAAESVTITNGVTSPTIDINQATTTVTIRNGTTIIIGGLIRDQTDDTVNKVPFLGDLPIVGPLFSTISKTKEKREIMIFLTPYVAFTAAQLEEITELEKARLKVIDIRDIEAECEQWLTRVRH
ncbi:MAG TPA: secretin N-terminal domain-containing protein [Planctomycetota bacterium]|nr:secretin N-terminal domain-containing protein [Planctomycetota bacterium]